MATSKMEAAQAFAVGVYKKNPSITGAELTALAKRSGINLYPTLISAARKKAGLGKGTPGRRPGTASAGAKPTPVVAAAVIAHAMRGPGRPPKAAAPVSDAMGSLNALVEVGTELKRLDAELKAAMGKLAKIAEICAS